MINNNTSINYVTFFSSCRLGPMQSIVNCSNIHHDITFTHSSKEIIQLLKFIRQEINIPIEINQYLFRTGILQNSPIYLTQDIIKKFKESQLFIIEICS